MKTKIITMVSIVAIVFCGILLIDNMSNGQPIDDNIYNEYGQIEYGDASYSKSGTRGEACSFNSGNMNYGGSGYVFSVITGMLPEGMNIEYSDGATTYQISGTPTMSGHFYSKVKCIRSDGSTFLDTWTIQITDPTTHIINLGNQGGSNSTFNYSAGDSVIILGYYNWNKNPLLSVSTSVSNAPSWLISTGGSPVSSYAGIVPVGTSTIQIRISGAGSSSYFDLVINASATVHFNANGGSFDDGSTTKDMTTSDTMILPSVDRYQYEFTYWYTASTGGTRVGTSGASYTPTESGITLYAHWSLQKVKIDSTCVTQVDSGGVFEYTPQTTPSNTTIKIVSDPTNCLSVSNRTITGTLADLLPGTYYIRINASYTGYSSATQTIKLTVPVFVYDPITDVVNVNNPWTHSITVNPLAAKITGYTVKDENNSTVDTGKYTFVKADKSITVTFNEKGKYAIDLTIGATGYTSTTKKLLLEVINPEEDLNDPTFSRIIVTEHETLDGAFYFTVYQPAHYTSITWDFGDGTSATNGSNVVHQYTTSGEKKITLTLFNSWNGKSVVDDSTKVTVILQLRSINDAWVGVEYSYSFLVTNHLDVPGGSYIMEAAYSDGGSQAWLVLSEFNNDASKYLMLSGTPQDTLGGSVLNVVVKYVTYEGDGVTISTSETVKILTINIWEHIDEDTISVGISVSINGYEVTITNNGSSGTGVRMFVDWGDGNGYIKSVSSSTSTHTYDSDGYYNIIADCLINGQSYKTTGYAIVPSTDSVSHTVTYSGNLEGVTGTMDVQSGTMMTVMTCSFVSDLYEFDSWNTSSDGKGTTFHPGDSITPDEDITLYAIWSNMSDDDNGNSNHINWKLIVIIIIIILIVILVLRMII